MDSRIEKALNLRISLIEYLETAKKISGGIRKTFEIDNRRVGEDLWTKWREIAQNFQNEKDYIAPVKLPKELPELVKKYTYEFKPILKDTIIQILAETLIIGFDISVISFFKGGFRFNTKYDLSDPNFNKIYRIPEDILDIISDRGESSNYSDWIKGLTCSIWSCDLLHEVFKEIAYENHKENVLKFSLCRPDGGNIALPIILPMA